MAVKLFVLIFGMSEREKLFTMMPGENSCQGICCVIFARAAPQVDHFLVSNIDAQLSILLPTCAESGIKNRGPHKKQARKLQATLVRNYDRPTDSLTGVKCRATSVAKNDRRNSGGTLRQKSNLIDF